MGITKMMTLQYPEAYTYISIAFTGNDSLRRK